MYEVALLTYDLDLVAMVLKILNYMFYNILEIKITLLFYLIFF